MSPSPDDDLVAKLDTIFSCDPTLEKLCNAPSNVDIFIERPIGRGALWNVYQGTLWRDAPTRNVRIFLQSPDDTQQLFPDDIQEEGISRPTVIDCSSSSGSNGSYSDSDDGSTMYPSPVAIKVCYIDDFDESDPELSLSPTEAHQSARHEIQIYERARQLGLNALVNLYAAYHISTRGGRQAYLVVLDLCGPSIDYSSLRASDLYVSYQWSSLVR